MNKIEQIEELLDERLELAFKTEEEIARRTGKAISEVKFFEDNADYVYYKGMRKMLLALGYDFTIAGESHKHSVWKVEEE